ncbi:MAG: hypothetical protein ACRDOA_10240 [Streptosporangiaceae bacterium]
MSESFAAGGVPAWRSPGLAAEGRLATLDTRRKLQLALGLIWVLDGILQYQPFMFSKAFPQMLAATSSGNPAVVAGPINWSSTLITDHLVTANALFATIQLALGLGIAFRPTVKAVRRPGHRSPRRPGGLVPVARTSRPHHGPGRLG